MAKTSLKSSFLDRLAFLWLPADRSYTTQHGLSLTKNGTPYLNPAADGVGMQLFDGQYFLGPSNNPVVRTANGSGTGDFSLLVFDNSAGTDTQATGRTLVSIRSNTGATYNQVGIHANKNTAGSYLAGSLAFWTYSSGYQAQAVSGAIDGLPHVRLLTRVGTTLYLYQDGVLLGSVGGSAQNINADDSQLGIGIAPPSYNEKGSSAIFLAAGWDRSFSAAEAIAISSTARRLPTARRAVRGTRFGIAAAGDTYSLTASNLAGTAPTLQSGALTQEHALAASALAGASPTLQSPALSQDHSLAASNISGNAPTLGTPALTLAGTLVASDLVGSAPVLQSATLTQNHSLTASNLAGTAPVLQSPALTQAHTVTANNLLGAAPALDAPALSASGDTYALSANSISGAAPALALAVLTQQHSLTATPLLGASPVLSSPAFGQQHLLTGSDIVVGVPTLGTPALTSGSGTGASAEEIAAAVVAALNATAIPVNIEQVHAVPLAGDGSDGNPWRAA